MSMCACTCAGAEEAPEPAREDGTPPAAAPEAETARRMDMELTSGDGLIRISVHAAADEIPSAMPVLKLRPRTITPDMARRMAEGAFGTAELYEASQELSRAEISEMIAAYEYAVVSAFSWMPSITVRLRTVASPSGLTVLPCCCAALLPCAMS